MVSPKGRLFIAISAILMLTIFSLRLRLHREIQTKDKTMTQLRFSNCLKTLCCPMNGAPLNFTNLENAQHLTSQPKHQTPFSHEKSLNLMMNTGHHGTVLCIGVFRNERPQLVKKKAPLPSSPHGFSVVQVNLWVKKVECYAWINTMTFGDKTLLSFGMTRSIVLKLYISILYIQNLRDMTQVGL